MEKKGIQAELFQPINHSGKSSYQSRNSLFDHMSLTLRFDQLLLVLIVLVMVNVIVYSTGVEAGKKRYKSLWEAERLKNQLITLELSRQVKALPEPEVTPFAETEQPALSESRLPIVTDSTKTNESRLPDPFSEAVVHLQGKYTIQLATYYAKQDAERQLTKLKERGLNGFTIPSGRYIQVCVNSFASRQTATSMLMQLKADRIAPSDAFVRNRPVSV